MQLVKRIQRWWTIQRLSTQVLDILKAGLGVQTATWLQGSAVDPVLAWLDTQMGNMARPYGFQAAKIVLLPAGSEAVLFEMIVSNHQPYWTAGRSMIAAQLQMALTEQEIQVVVLAIGTALRHVVNKTAP